jgi:hypothetical protein
MCEQIGEYMLFSVEFSIMAIANQNPQNNVLFTDRILVAVVQGGQGKMRVCNSRI